MPKSKRWEFLPALVVEMTHDELVATIWAFDEPVQPHEFRNKALLDSAVNRPFQSAFGSEIHPTIFDKTAALFHSLIPNHPFTNGNKRTAVLAADLFLLASDFCLVLDQQEIYRLAKLTAQHNERGIPPEAMVAMLRDKFKKYSVPVGKIGGSKERDDLRKFLVTKRKAIRTAIPCARIVEALRRNWDEPRPGINDPRR